MTNLLTSRTTYDLEERTFLFAERVRLLVKTLPKSLIILEDSKQLIRASGSVGANYLEANEALSKKNFLLHMKISRKEAKESVYWLRLLIETNQIRESSEAENLMQKAI